ncbi:MAG: hypothetical protein M3Z30_06995 [Gemmatimonadota bacterium]|nr:hypothetical protein [Gemmatimonadota bacterium]
MRRYTEGSREGASPILPGGKMDFGAMPVFDGRIAPVPEPTLNLAWFERSSAGEVAPDRATENSALLDRVREAEGLVYNGDGDYET